MSSSSLANVDAILRFYEDAVIAQLAAVPVFFRNRPEPVLDFSADVWGRDRYPGSEPDCDC